MKNRLHKTSVKKSSSKSKRQMIKDLSFTLHIEDPFKGRRLSASEIAERGRGCGVEQSKKGKGSYTRRAKHIKPCG